MMMKTLGVEDEYMENCPIRNVLARVASKWALVVMHVLLDNGTTRFNELRHHIPDISQKMLTATLRTLVADGLVGRTVYPEVPPRVEYTLTERGRSFMDCAGGLIEWALRNMADILRDRSRAKTA